MANAQPVFPFPLFDADQHYYFLHDIADLRPADQRRVLSDNFRELLACA